ncbi:LLM class flavin-dependent oxidoreductase [Kineococcus glutinatus]|uniref:LLM class flavin-dependent oxidoreductase n=1 Tax=Kineococcus glutinatus TaxID=1070872 RepID=A0ABP8VE43_9ACTN
MSQTSSPAHLAVALDGAGWHPGAWRAPGARPAELLQPGYWTDLLAEAERGLLDLVTIEDSLLPQSEAPLRADERTDRVRGRLDAVLVAARVAPTTSRIGIVPVVTTAHTEPFHVSTGIATLDVVSCGRAGYQVRTGGRGGEARLFGRRPELDADVADPPSSPLVADLFEEAADHVEVVRRLWDSWEDDAVVRDAATGRFVDREKLHHVDFAGRWFSVRGPSITPRPPQGQPVVAALAHVGPAYRLAARQADVVFTTPLGEDGPARVLADVRAAEDAAGRGGHPLLVFADLLVVLGEDAPDALRRKESLDALAGAGPTSDAAVVAGGPAELADAVERLLGAGFAGVRLRPAALPHDLTAVTGLLVPELQRRGLFRREYAESTLRERLGLPRPANRYAA